MIYILVYISFILDFFISYLSFINGAQEFRTFVISQSTSLSFI